MRTVRMQLAKEKNLAIDCVWFDKYEKTALGSVLELCVRKIGEQNEGNLVKILNIELPARNEEAPT